MVTFDSTDLDNAVSESGVVHESVANTDHDDASKLKQGYSAESPYLSTDLAGYWPLQEDSGTTAYDFSGNNNDGSVVGATVNQTGLLGTSAYSFDGTDDSVDLGEPDGMAASNVSQFTLTVWFYVRTHGGRIVNHGSSSANDNFALYHRSGDQWRVYFDSGGTVDITFYPTLDTWTHLAVTWDGSTLTRYMDASDSLSDSASGWADATGSPWSIGSKNGNSWFFDGRIADVRFYDQAFTSTEVQTLYDVVNTAGTLTTGYQAI